MFSKIEINWNTAGKKYELIFYKAMWMNYLCPSKNQD
jgi:hypothetical protein